MSSADRADTFRKAALWTLLGVFVARAVGLARSFYFVASMPDAELGKWSVAYAVMPIGAWLLGLGVPAGLVRYLPQASDMRLLLPLFKALGALYAIIAGLLLAVTVIWPQELALLLFGSRDSTALVYQFAVCLFLLTVLNVAQGLLQGRRRFRDATVLQVVQTSAFAAVGFIALGFWQASASAALWAHAAGSIAAVVAVAYLVLDRSDYRTGPASGADAKCSMPPSLSKFLAFSLGLCVAGALEDAWPIVDRFVLLHAWRADIAACHATVGQYHVAQTLIAPISIGLGLLGTVLLPYAALAYDTRGPRAGAENIASVLSITSVGATLAGAACLLLSGPVVVHLLGRPEGLWQEVLPLVCVTSVMAGLQHVYKCWFACRYTVWRLVTLWAFMLALNGGLSVCLLRAVGPAGPAVATAVAAAASAGVMCLVAGYASRDSLFKSGVALFLPCVLLLPKPALVVLLLVLPVSCACTDWIWGEKERQILWRELTSLAHHVGFGRAQPCEEGV